MYATRIMTEIYHLVQPGGQHTLCGLEDQSCDVGTEDNHTATRE